MNQAEPICLFLCGDVMTGRGIDQVLPHPVNPVLYEAYIRDARDYMQLPEFASGPIPQPVDFTYIWGDALDELERVGMEVRIINLETSITSSTDYWRHSHRAARSRSTVEPGAVRRRDGGFDPLGRQLGLLRPR